MDVIEIGLATRSPHVSRADLEPIAAALDVQAKRDVLPIWGVSATVRVIDDLTQVPVGLSPIIIEDQLPGDMHGVHTSDNGLAFALILAGPGWQLATSHECIELMIDPTGSRTMSGRGLMIQDGVVQDSGETVDYILEASDPVEDARYGYMIDGVLVSDFYTPRYFDDAVTPGVRYSQTGALTRPRQVGANGYLSWQTRQGVLLQLRCFGAPQIITLRNQPDATGSQAPGAPSLRRLIDAQTHTPRVKALRQGA